MGRHKKTSRRSWSIVRPIAGYSTEVAGMDLPIAFMPPPPQTPTCEDEHSDPDERSPKASVEPSH